MCADDYFHPKGLSDVIDEWASSKPSIAFICFNPNAGNNKLRQYAYSVLPKKYSSNGIKVGVLSLLGNFTGNLSNVSVKVSVVNSTGGFVEHLKTAQDFEMWHRLSKKNDIILSDKKNVVFVREHTGSATHYLTQKGDDYGQLITIYEDLLEQLSIEHKRKKLISYFNTQISSQYFRTAIKHALSGKFTFMKTMLRTKSPLLWNIWSQLFICTPLALSPSLREYLAMKWAQKFYDRNNWLDKNYASSGPVFFASFFFLFHCSKWIFTLVLRLICFSLLCFERM